MTTIGSGGGLNAAMMSGMQGMRPSPQQLAQDLFSNADSNNDGSVSQEEFSALIQGTGSSADSSTISGLFSQMDSDGDGSLTSQDISNAVSNLMQSMQQSMMGANGNMPPPPPPPGAQGAGDAASRAADFISNADSNDDGNLDLTEFSSAFQSTDQTGSSDNSARIESMFNEADSNGDGTVTQDELQTAMANHRPPPPPPPPQDAQGQGQQGSGSDQLSNLVQSLIAQYQSQQEDSSTLNVSA